MLTAADQRELLSTLEVNWQMEMESHATYRALAQKEVDARRRNVMRGLAAAERQHARLWAVEIASLGGIPPTYLGSPNGHADAFLAKPNGIDLALRRLRKQERAEIERYKLQALTLTDEASQTTLREVIADENEHYKSLSRLIRARPPVANLAAQRRRKHSPHYLPRDARNILRQLAGSMTRSMPRTRVSVRSSESCRVSPGLPSGKVTTC